MSQISDKSLVEFKSLCDKQGIKFKTEVEYKDAAWRLEGLARLLVKAAQEELQRQERLKKEPDGFEMEGEGRSCSLCLRSIHGEEKIWYDKLGFKCSSCKEAYEKKIIPGYAFTDHDNKRHITDFTLSWKFNIRTQTIRKLVRQGKLRAREIPGSRTLVFLKKENPNLVAILEHEKKSLENQK